MPQRVFYSFSHLGYQSSFCLLAAVFELGELRKQLLPSSQSLFFNIRVNEIFNRVLIFGAINEIFLFEATR